MDAIKNSSSLVQTAGPFGDGDEDDGVARVDSSTTITTGLSRIRSFLKGNKDILYAIGIMLLVSAVTLCSCKTLDAFIHYDDGEKKIEGELHTTGKASNLTDDGAASENERVLFTDSDINEE